MAPNGSKEIKLRQNITSMQGFLFSTFIHYYVENKCILSDIYKRSAEFSSIRKISVFFLIVINT